jgi:hypothetical protein
MLSRSEKLLTGAVLLGFLHHVDHILRADHSGWPFVSLVTPFTYSLLVYPLFIAVFVLRRRPWARVVITAFLLASVTLTHTFLETPLDQYHTWAYGSSMPDHFGQHNLTGHDSLFLGVCAAVVTVLLSFTLLAALISFAVDARRVAHDDKQMRG